MNLRRAGSIANLIVSGILSAKGVGLMRLIVEEKYPTFILIALALGTSAFLVDKLLEE